MEVHEVPEHEHSLKLIDLQLEYPLYFGEVEEEDDDDDGGESGDPTAKEGFHGVKCERCDHEIHIYHRYYYKCMGDSSCHFSLHKFCAELSTRLEHPSHSHPLIQKWMTYNDWACRICEQKHKSDAMSYNCFECKFRIDVHCAVEAGKKIIHHPCHPHLLICAITKPILCHCSACGRRREGIFFQCTTCTNFTIHSICAFLPKTLLIQHTTDDAFYHTHPLTVSYSFSWIDYVAKHYPRCRVCRHSFYDIGNCWIYKCDKCMYYAHVDCTTSRREPFMSIFLSAGVGKIIKNFKDVDHPDLLHLPFPDETYSIPKLLFSQERGRSDEVKLTHASHQHPLILVDQTQCNRKTSSNEINSSLLMCHDPMKKTQLICNGCVRPIMSTMSFYKCFEDCNFALHEWCTRLPPKIENYLGHPQHTLLLMYSNVLPRFFGVFTCEVCTLPCNGFAYCCVHCGYYVDLTCGFIPIKITHKSHPNHILSIRKGTDNVCDMCRQVRCQDNLSFSCNTRAFGIHPECALLKAETIRHKYDKHPMHLSYLPIENHKSEYFCEICEEDLDPHQSFYHCQDCVQSVHAACAPLILQSEKHTHSYHWQNIYYFVNIKFGGIHNTPSHPHPLFFAQGIVLDGQCSICGKGLQYEMIFKCLRV